MSRIRRAMMGRYIILMTILLISLAALMLALSNYVEIQNSKQELDAILDKAYVAIKIDER